MIENPFLKLDFYVNSVQSANIMLLRFLHRNPTATGPTSHHGQQIWDFLTKKKSGRVFLEVSIGVVDSKNDPWSSAL